MSIVRIKERVVVGGVLNLRARLSRCRRPRSSWRRSVSGKLAAQ